MARELTSPELALCLCGIRGCPAADQHAAGFVTTSRPSRGRTGRRTRKR